MNTTAEMKIEVSNARIRNATLMPDGTCKIKIEMEIPTQNQNNENAKDDCILVEASKLSLNDNFMLYKPKTREEKAFKATLTEVIKNGIEDFYRPIMDPSFSDKEKTKIHYMAGEKPAVAKSYNWWKETIKDSKWCFGTKAQYVAFLGVLIKMLVYKGWTAKEAWDAVCNDSKKLGNYCVSYDAKEQLEDTGSREICGFFDLANTYKILAEDEKEGHFFLASGSYRCKSSFFQLAKVARYIDSRDFPYNTVAWLVCKK